ncbi:L7Ae/L30e/S12e/Gadd45 family ribosomal protein [Caproicibacter sp.]|uniref:L7Ae/L30e/S12e/Gadd45 family ribosomal protein n=1 Tax=Caproicibacter sp. TaxID=2814884 RepID=UPI00398A4CA8
MGNRLLSLLGIARRAGKLCLGSDAVQETALKGGCPLILFASDLSPRTARTVLAAAAKGNVETATLRENMDEIGCAIGKRTGVIAVNDKGFAKKLLALNAED